MSLIATSLTDRQRQLLILAREGYTIKEIAIVLGITLDTVKAHLAAIRDRLNARNTTHAVIIAARCDMLRIKHKGG